MARRRIVVAFDDVAAARSGNVEFVQLPNPKNGSSMVCAIAGSSLFELQSCRKEPSSWLIGNSVEKDGTLFIATPLDPLFIVLPTLRAGRRKGKGSAGAFCPLDELLVSQKYPALIRLKDLASFHPDSICDSKDVGVMVHRLNDEKVLAWLKQKVEAVAAHLAASESNNVKTDGSTSAAFRTHSSSKASESTQSSAVSPDHLRSSLGIMCEYLEKDLFDELLSSFSVSRDEVFPKIKPSADAALTADVDSSIHKSELGKRKAPEPKVAKPKLTKNDAKGMKSLASYFGKPKAAKK